MKLVLIRRLADCPPKFSEIINFLPVHLLLVRFQLQEGQGVVFSSPYTQVNISGHVRRKRWNCKTPLAPEVSSSDRSRQLKPCNVADKDLR